MTIGVSVVVPTRGRSGSLPSLVDTLLTQQVDRTFEIIVVDDCSDDDTWSVLGTLAAANARLKPLRLPVHGGPGAARNLGWRAAQSPIVAFTDDDCRPTKGWLQALVDTHERGADLVQGKTIPNPDQWEQRGAFSHTVQIEEFNSRFESCNVSYRRDLLDRLDGFDEAFGTSRGGAPYAEDADLGWRAIEVGAIADLAADAIVLHAVLASSFSRYLKGMLRRRRFVYFLSRHPGFRAFMPQPWLFTPTHIPALVVIMALTGLAVAPDWPMLLVVGVATTIYFRDWIRFRQRPGRRRNWPVVITGFLVTDILEIAVLLAGSVQWRTLVI